MRPPRRSCILLAGFLVGCSDKARPRQAGLLLAGFLARCSGEPSATPSEPPSLRSRPMPRPRSRRKPAPAKTAAKGDEETVKIGACDGGNAVEVSKELKGQPLADSLMDQWKRNHPEAKWVAEEKERHTLQPPADNADLLKGGQAKGDTYGNFTERDLLTWARETEKFAAEGSRIFHSADELGSTVAVSCDMCHPHAANTHPETYPKFQVAVGPRRPAPRHDQLVHREPRARRQAGAGRPEDAGLGGLYPGAAQRRSHELRETLMLGGTSNVPSHRILRHRRLTMRFATCFAVLALVCCSALAADKGTPIPGRSCSSSQPPWLSRRSASSSSFWMPAPQSVR